MRSLIWCLNSSSRAEFGLIVTTKRSFSAAPWTWPRILLKCKCRRTRWSSSRSYLCNSTRHVFSGSLLPIDAHSQKRITLPTLQPLRLATSPRRQHDAAKLAEVPLDDACQGDLPQAGIPEDKDTPSADMTSIPHDISSISSSTRREFSSTTLSIAAHVRGSW